jgi:upstream activation factor subunit UAF30
MATLDQLYTLLLATQKDLKNLAKQVRRVNTRFDDPDGSKAKERAKNNGFNRAQRITPELASFLDVPEDEMLSRSAVTRRVNAYIRANELKHPENGRVIMIEKDEKLKALLKVPEDEQLTYLNIQKYLSPHYIKEPPVDPNADPADLNGDGRTTRSEAAEHAERTESPAPAPVTASPTPTPAPATASPKKKPVVTKKKPVIRKPIAQA